MTPGAGMPMVVELALQEAIVVGLHALAENLRSMEELVHRVDALRGSTAPEWERELKAALRDMLNPNSDNYASVLLNYPAGLARLPCLSIVEESGGMNEAEQVVGRVLREADAFVGPNQELWGTTEIGGGESSTMEIAAWSPIPEAALLLRAAARWALDNQRPLLEERGIHEITSIRTSGLQVPGELEPRVSWTPILTVGINWTLRQSYRQKVPNRITIRPGRFTT